MELLAVPATLACISLLRLCPAGCSAGYVVDEDGFPVEECPACDGTGLDLDCLQGCCDFHEPEPGGAVIVIDPEGGGFRPAGA